MILSKLQYSQYEGHELEWMLDELKLGKRNLIVGRNASGKSMTLNVINGLALHLLGVIPVGLSGKYDATFADGERTIRYQLDYSDSVVTRECFALDGRVYLERGQGGDGLIWANEINGGDRVRFQTPPNQLAAVMRRDAIQHPFLEPLHTWANAVRHYRFGHSLGKESLVVFSSNSKRHPDARDQNATAALYNKGRKEFGEEFEKAIIEDLAAVGYEIERIEIGPMVSIRMMTEGPGEVVGLRVKEKALNQVTDQFIMSQGMFRALALFIHLNFGRFTKGAACVLIDDIGEGLDFERACQVIERLRSKTQDGDIQIVLTTNDRFVMNSVPLNEWTILQRNAGHVVVRNDGNSHDQFEEFRFTGLSNFSFFEMNLINENKDTPNEATGNIH